MRAMSIAMILMLGVTPACTTLKNSLLDGNQDPAKRARFCRELAVRADTTSVEHVWAAVASFAGATAAVSVASAYDFDGDQAALYRGLLAGSGALLTAAGGYFVDRAGDASDAASAAIAVLGNPDKIQDEGFEACAIAYSEWIGDRTAALDKLRGGMDSAQAAATKRIKATVDGQVAVYQAELDRIEKDLNAAAAALAKGPGTAEKAALDAKIEVHEARRRELVQIIAGLRAIIPGDGADGG